MSKINDKQKITGKQSSKAPAQKQGAGSVPVVALVFGILSVVAVAFLPLSLAFGITGIALAAAAAKRTGGEKTGLPAWGTVLSIAGISLSVIVTIFILFAMAPLVSPEDEDADVMSPIDAYVAIITGDRTKKEASEPSENDKEILDAKDILGSFGDGGVFSPEEPGTWTDVPTVSLGDSAKKVVIGETELSTAAAIEGFDTSRSEEWGGGALDEEVAPGEASTPIYLTSPTNGDDERMDYALSAVVTNKGDSALPAESLPMTSMTLDATDITEGIPASPIELGGAYLGMSLQEIAAKFGTPYRILEDENYGDTTLVYETEGGDKALILLLDDTLHVTSITLQVLS